MLFTSWLRSLRSASPSGRVQRNRRRSAPFRAATRSRPQLEVLEDRTLLSGVSFSPPASYGVGANPHAAAVGDFNGDGKPDLVVANQYDANVGVLLGNGEGTFQAARTFAVGNDPLSVVVGDFNGDGKLDLAVATYVDNTVSVLLGNGEGTFQPAQKFAVPYSVGSVAVGDLNGDGKLDLVAVSNFNTVAVLLGNGDGTFQPAQFTAGVYSTFVTVADFNGDGKPDLALAGGSRVTVLLGRGDGAFQPAQNFAVGYSPFAPAFGDFNGDGKLDLAVGYAYGTTVSVLAGNGDGTFQPAQNLAFGYGSGHVAVGDFNRDGKLDLAVATENGILLSVLPGNGDGTFRAAQTFAAGPTALGAVVVADFNSDGKPDLAVTNLGYQGSVSVLMNNLPVNPAPLSATAVNFSATAGAPFSGGVATFTNVDPYGSAASYTAIITWGDGTISTGTITGTGTLTVSGSHTYADPINEIVTVQISDNLGNTTTATVSDTAAVTSLGLGVKHGLTGDIGFWHNSSGQALINSFNGGSTATALSSWLATAFPNLYGGLGGETNAQVAAFYQTEFGLPSPTVEAQVLATALNVYATTQSLGGTAGQAYGFTVTATGLGADSFNVGADGAAFGVANKTTLNVYELLKAADRQVVNGVLYNGDKTLRNEANDLFNALNKAGAIS